MLPAEMDVLIQNKQVCHVEKCPCALELRPVAVPHAATGGDSESICKPVCGFDVASGCFCLRPLASGRVDDMLLMVPALASLQRSWKNRPNLPP